MKKVVSVVVCIVLTVMCFYGCGKEKIASVNSKITNMPPFGQRYVTAFGDSIAAGYGLDDQNNNYIALFSQNIGAQYKNNAVSGYDSNDLLKQLKSGRYSKDIDNANIVILSIGGNDILHQKDLMLETIKNAYLHGGEYFTDELNQIYAEFENNLRDSINLIKTRNPNASVIIQTIYNPAIKQGYYVSVINVGKLADKYIQKLNDSILSVCTGVNNVYIFDIVDKMNDDENNFYNLEKDFDIHPTVTGHKTLSDIYTDNFNMLIS